MNAKEENGGGGRPGFGALSQRVIGCALALSNGLGAGFLESVYQNALCFELSSQGIAFERQKQLIVTYRAMAVGRFCADLVVERKLLVELKALKQFTSEHGAQLMNYLRATGLRVGLLLNFGSPRLGIRRIVSGYDEDFTV